jgi:transmembrane sensor
MEDSRINYLYEKYLIKGLTIEELEEFRALVIDPKAEAQFRTLLDDRWDQLVVDGLPDVPEEVDQKVYHYIVQQKPVRNISIKLWPRIVAASVIVVLAFAGLFYYNLSHQHQASQLVYKDAAAPGKIGATLTLANGKKIRLNEAQNGELAEEAGVVITKSTGGQLIYEMKSSGTNANKINTLSTSKGETYQLRLPDGSLVWLNAASSVSYSSNLNTHGKRRVKLNGEAYFEIFRDEAHPFVVESKGQEVEVLGTHFNINAYEDEPLVLTTLLKGSVRVTSAQGRQLLKPGEQALNNGSSIKVAKANLENVMDWKDGDFFLDRINFKLAMRKIARWYNVDIVYADDVPDQLEAGGWISRDNQLSTVLNSIEKSGIAHFKIEGRTIYVSK